MHVELGRWQSKYPGGLEPAAPDDGVEEEVPGWNGNPKLVAPLFRAYDERVRSLEQQLEACKAPTKKLEEQVQMVVAENEGLLKQLKAAYGGFSDEDGQSRPTLEKWFFIYYTIFSCKQRREMQNQVELLEEENQILTQQQQKTISELATAAQRLKEVEPKCTLLLLSIHHKNRRRSTRKITEVAISHNGAGASQSPKCKFRT